MKRLDEPFTVLPQNYTVPDPLQSPAPTASPELEDPTPTASVTIDSAPPLPVSFIFIAHCNNFIFKYADRFISLNEIHNRRPYRGVRTNYFTLALLYFGNDFRL